MADLDERAGGAAQGIRSRIAAFEDISGSSGSVNAAKAAPQAANATTGSKLTGHPKSNGRVAVNPGHYDPLMAPGSSAGGYVPTQSMLRSTSWQDTRPHHRSISTSSTSPGSVEQGAQTASILLFGVTLRSGPPPKHNTKSTASGGPDQLITSPTSVRSMQQHLPLAPSPSSSPVSSPARTPSSEEAEKTYPTPSSWSSASAMAASPRIPVRLGSASSSNAGEPPPIPTSSKPKFPKSSFASPNTMTNRGFSPKTSFAHTEVTIQPPSPLPTGPASTARAGKPCLHSVPPSPGPVPSLPPRKAGSTMSADGSSSGIGVLPRPPQRLGSSLPAAAPTSPSLSSSVPSRIASAASTSITSISPPLPSAAAFPRPSDPPNASNVPLLPPRPGSATPAPSPTSTMSLKPHTSSLPLPLSPAIPQSTAVRPVSRSPALGPLQKPAVRNALGAGQISSQPVIAKRYLDLWNKIENCVKPERDGTGQVRLDATVVREVWKRSRLSDPVLARIW
ncbi:MAG: hypothetical protein CYPHOPRED_006123 [Cyphobasidiales sp. Tagirdzhanova-0007]|nr:MAG: hypothetical protein CYPHOPRED_006123 [Cyphobasidiales sp. Tagirdzhanova-0007]